MGERRFRSHQTSIYEGSNWGREGDGSGKVPETLMHAHATAAIPMEWTVSPSPTHTVNSAREKNLNRPFIACAQFPCESLAPELLVPFPFSLYILLMGPSMDKEIIQYRKFFLNYRLKSEVVMLEKKCNARKWI